MAEVLITLLMSRVLRGVAHFAFVLLFPYVPFTVGIISRWSTSAGVCNKPEAVGYVFLERKHQMLIFF